jgi:hypothetical protein
MCASELSVGLLMVLLGLLVAALSGWGHHTPPVLVALPEAKLRAEGESGLRFSIVICRHPMRLLSIFGRTFWNGVECLSIFGNFSLIVALPIFIESLPRGRYFASSLRRRLMWRSVRGSFGDARYRHVDRAHISAC